MRTGVVEGTNYKFAPAEGVVMNMGEVNKAIGVVLTIKGVVQDAFGEVIVNTAVV